MKWSFLAVLADLLCQEHRDEWSCKWTLAWTITHSYCPSCYRHRQDHKIFVEIAKCAEKCLREASKYGEVRWHCFNVACFCRSKWMLVSSYIRWCCTPIDDGCASRLVVLRVSSWCFSRFDGCAKARLLYLLPYLSMYWINDIYYLAPTDDLGSKWFLCPVWIPSAKNWLTFFLRRCRSTFTVGDHYYKLRWWLGQILLWTYSSYTFTSSWKM